MLMPGLDRPTLAEPLEALRTFVMGLPLAERRQLMHALAGDISRENDRRHAEAHERAEQARNRRRPDSRQMSLESAA